MFNFKKEIYNGVATNVAIANTNLISIGEKVYQSTNSDKEYLIGICEFDGDKFNCRIPMAVWDKGLDLGLVSTKFVIYEKGTMIVVVLGTVATAQSIGIDISKLDFSIETEDADIEETENAKLQLFA